MTRSRVLALEGATMTILATAYLISGRLLGAAILVLLGALAFVCAWALLPPTTSSGI